MKDEEGKSNEAPNKFLEGEANFFLQDANAEGQDLGYDEVDAGKVNKVNEQDDVTEED
jgi:hypothetical protein